MNTRVLAIYILLFLLSPIAASAQDLLASNNVNANHDIDLFLDLIYENDAAVHEKNLNEIRDNWKDEYAIMLVEIVLLSRDRELVTELVSILNQKTSLRNSYDFEEWFDYIWDKDQQIVEKYPDFKARLYRLIDSKFEKYFAGRENQSEIRFDEIRWGGVLQDGIPPLRNPEMIDATDANYLEDDNIIFGIEVDGDVRAYPKRILAWHEMFVDEVGGIPVAGVYCTLCGTVILYKTEHEGIQYEMGTSGFLYRSNKLMYDKKTQSLWNTLWGTPSVGPLVGKGIQLEHMSVVTTTWGEWKRRHPDTKVLSLNTGHTRNYGEGVAYKEYFATDQVMFSVPYNDKRLKNKDEVLAIRFNEFPDEQLAISAKFLKKRPVYMDKVGTQEFVVFTDKTGGNRVFETEGIEFKSYDRDKSIKDVEGNTWTLYEDKIVSEHGKTLERLPYHRAFWFGWHAAFPNTRLVK